MRRSNCRSSSSGNHSSSSYWNAIQWERLSDADVARVSRAAARREFGPSVPRALQVCQHLMGRLPRGIQHDDKLKIAQSLGEHTGKRAFEQG